MARLTAKKIEEKGQRILCDYFSECDRVDTYIHTNDKEPLWDGNIFLFSSSEQKADQVHGRIPAQLKSSSRSSSKDTCTFQVKTTALEAYKREGGIAYFYVLINNPQNAQIYYSLLTPVVIKRYLNEPSKGEKVPIILKKLPADKKTVIEELFQFFFDCKKQTSSADKPIVEIQDYFNHSGNRQFSVFAQTPNPVKDIFKHMQGHYHYLYATDADNNVTFAIGDGPYKIKIGKNVQQDISVDGVTYFNHCSCFEDDEETIMVIDDFFTFRTGNNKKDATINFKFDRHSNLGKIHYLSFCLAIINSKKFSIGSVDIPCEGLQASKDTVQRMKGELDVLSKVRSLFKTMHIEGDINLDELDGNAFSNLKSLYRGIVLNEPLDLKQGFDTNMRIGVGPLVIYVKFEPSGDGKFFVKDFFLDDAVCSMLTQDGVTTKSSRFSLLDVEHFVEASNFDYSLMIQSYEEFAKDSEKVAEYAQLDMLRMILAYDKTDGKKTILLDAAETLNNWFIKTHRFCESPINEINHFQIQKRRGSLSDADKTRICEILESDVAEDCKTACMLLLDNQTGADYHFKKIPNESKEFFKSLPICHFWK